MSLSVVRNGIVGPVLGPPSIPLRPGPAQGLLGPSCLARRVIWVSAAVRSSPQISRSQFSEAEPQSDRGSDVVVLEKAESQTAIHLREHDPGIEIPLRCKPPIDSGRDRVERPGALRVLGAEAGAGPQAAVPKKEFWI